MEIRLLNTFVAVASLGNFTHAAERLGYAQSSVTSQIQALESELGAKLFERLGKSISLTPEGTKLLVYAKQILRLFEDALDAVSPTGALKGALCIGAPESLCSVRLLPIFTEYHNLYPDVELTLKFGGSPVFLNMLKNNEIDIALYIDRHTPPAELTARLQWPEPIVLLASPEHPLVRAKQVFPQNLADQMLILTESGCSYRARLLHVLSEAGESPKSTLESGNVEVMKQLAISGMGIAFLPRVAAQEELDGGRLAELDWAGPDFGLSTFVVHHKDKWISPAMEAFIHLAETELSSRCK